MPRRPEARGPRRRRQRGPRDAVPTEVESFTKVVSYSVGNGPEWFKVWTKSGLILEYGSTPDSRITIQHSASVRLWALKKVADRSGNYYHLNYDRDDSTGEYWILQIDYRGNEAAGLLPYNSVRFTYESQPDQAANYYMNLVYRQHKRLTHIKTYHESTVVKDYRVSYQTSPVSGRSLTSSVTECDAVGACLGALTFGYHGTGSIGVQTNLGNMVAPRNVASLQAGDFNGDGIQDVYVIDDWNQARICYGPTFAAASCTTSVTGPPRALVLDWDGDGLSDIAWYVPSSGFIFCRGPNPFPSGNCFNTPNAVFPNYDWIVGDFNGDGLDELFGWDTVNAGQTFGMHCNPLAIIAIPGIQSGSTCNGRAVSGINHNVYKGDFDGDGQTDLFYTGVGGYVLCTGRSIQGLAGCAGVGAPNWRDNSQIVVGDFNGDGTSDLLRLTTTGLEFCPSPQLIYGINCTPVSGAWVGDWRSEYKARSGDYNGDGIADLILSSNPHTLVCQGPGIQSTVSCVLVTNQDWKALPIAVADFKGGGSSDILVGQGAHSTLVTGATHPSDRLYIATDTAFGISNSYSYRTLTDSQVYTKGTGAPYPLQDTRQPLWVVHVHSYPNGANGSNSTTYKYEKGRIDAASRRFLGYEIVKEYDAINLREIVTTRAQTHPHYYRVGDRKTYVNGVLAAKSWSELITGTSFEGRPVSRVANSYDVSYGLGGSWKSEKVGYGFDGYGNVVGENFYVDEFSTTAFRKIITLTFDNDPSQWLFGQLRSSTVTYHKNGGQSPESVVQRIDYTMVPGTHLVAQEIRDPANAATRLQTDYVRDPVGNVTSVTQSGIDILTRTESAGYDAKKRFPVTRTNALNQTTSQTYDGRFGVMTARTDPNNLTTSWSYDNFGRKTHEYRPGGFWTTWGYDMQYPITPSAKYRVVVGDIAGGNWQTSTSYDAFSRPLGTVRINFDGTNWNVEDMKEYDLYGRLAKRYLPFAGGQTNPPYKSWTYDNYDRMQTEVASNNAVTTFSYSAQPNAGPTTTTVTNANNQVTKYVRSVHGLLQQVIDANNKTTAYEYTALDKLLRTTDSAGVQMTMGYNAWGWETSKNDPSLGAWTFTYDVLGNRKTQTDAKSQVTTFLYDKLNRRTQRFEPSLDAVWTWDTAAYGIGKLASTTTTAGFNKAYTYDSLGRVSSRVNTIDGTSYTTLFGYDTVGRQIVHVYPTGFQIRRVFNSAGYLSEIRDHTTNALYWKVVAQSPAGITDEDYGNGTGVGRTFHPQTHRVTQITTIRDSDGAVLQDFTYGYDAIGNMTSRSETTQSLSETYEYDSLNRLWKVHGPAPKTYIFGDTGNIASKSDVGGYTYATPGKPHAVSAAGGVAYQYDANGNMISAGGKTIGWSSFNMPWGASEGVSTWLWAYDADFRRVKYTSPTETVRYFSDGNDVEMERVDIAGTTWNRHYIRGASGIVAVHATSVSGTPITRYVYRDHLGSTTLLLDPSGAIAERLSYDASGKRRHPSGADDSASSIFGSATDRGFTSHEHLDGLDLLHMNGRLYDARIGRFISSDPMMPSDPVPQRLNRYTYVQNDPLGRIDPTGLDDIVIISCINGCTLDPDLTRDLGPQDFGGVVQIIVEAQRLPSWSNLYLSWGGEGVPRIPGLEQGRARMRPRPQPDFPYPPVCAPDNHDVAQNAGIAGAWWGAAAGLLITRHAALHALRTRELVDLAAVAHEAGSSFNTTAFGAGAFITASVALNGAFHFFRPCP